METFKYNSKMGELELLKLVTQFIIYNLNKSKNATEFFKILQKSNIQTVLDKNKNLMFNVKNDKNKLIKSFKIDDFNSPDLTKQRFIERFKDFFERLELLHANSERNPKQAKIKRSGLFKWKDESGNTFFCRDKDKKNDYLFKQSSNGSITCKIWNKQSIDLLTQEQIKNGWSGVEVTTSDSEHLKNKINSWLKHKKNGSITDISLTPESSLKGLTLDELKETLGDRKLNDLELEHVKNNLLSEQVSDQELKNNFAMATEKPCFFNASNDPVFDPNEPEPTNKKQRKKRNLKLW
ncbi:hypothetical protein [Vibrio parahaemolyticus]|uniref:hypothetical protein n=1 Tax=Vibrio parahaemolyticus TaxID=670 RepID=UPI0004075E9A|nr:hypothetical protein [Vibrio parahaemolyticus]KJR14546.1 hypothetical protein UF29_22680 [Vibrio parahaemolyticus]HCE2689020.1 hypothetical protein [Vibrio parahaemolyticus]HCE2914142.1 hypothetical protein [Vibrio parahaemolyticus]HCG8556028.1 hypothetical protein [Vibrio parahaemolyticus]HCH0053246.1 hypothetical protein [Vibrio parahaemolyticus]